MRCHSVVHGAPNEALAIADEVLSAPSLPAPVEIGAVACRGFALQLLGRGEDSLDAVARLRILLKNPGLPAIDRTRGMSVASILLQRNGHIEEGLGLLESMLEQGIAESDVGAQIIALTGIALLRGEQMDDAEGALRYLKQAIELSDHLNRAPAQSDVMLYYNYGYALLDLKRYEEAGKAFEKAESIANRVPGQEIMLYRIRSHRAEVLRAGGQLEAAKKEFLSIKGWQQTNDALGQVVTLQRLAQIDLEQGHAEAARKLADQALALAEPAKFDEGIRNSLVLLAEIHLVLGDAAKARDYLRQASQADHGQMKSDTLNRLAKLQARAEQALDPLRIHASQDASSDRLLRNAAFAALALLLLGGGGLFLRMRRQQRRLRELGTTDALTELPNRREAERLLEAATSTSSSGSRSAVLLLEIDSFQTISDEQGHASGDLVLRAVADSLRAASDQHDRVCRWGGSTFLLIRQDSSQTAAFALAAHLCRSVERLQVEITPGQYITPTISIGVTSYPLLAGRASRPADSLSAASRCLQVARRNSTGNWAGLWGLDAGENIDPYSVLNDPENALAQGWVMLGSGRPVSWSPPRSTPGTGPTEIPALQRSETSINKRS